MYTFVKFRNSIKCLVSCWVFWTLASCHGSWWWLMLTPPVDSCKASSLNLCILICREPSISHSGTILSHEPCKYHGSYCTVNTKIYFFRNKLIVSRRKLCFFCFVLWKVHEFSKGLCKTCESVFWSSLNLEVIYTVVYFLSLREI